MFNSVPLKSTGLKYVYFGLDCGLNKIKQLEDMYLDFFLFHVEL